MLTKGQKAILSWIAEKDGKLNWYKISRIYVNKFNSPVDLSENFKYIEDEKLIESRSINDESLPRLFITEKGKRQL